MNVTLMAILLIAIVVFTVVTDKVPLNFVLLLVPFIFSLLLGHSLLQTSDFVLQQFAAAYLITFPILLPLFKKFNFDRGDAFMIAQTAMTGVLNLG
ncbi:hypothetical protein [Periweissella beninensis]|uniref:PIN-like protein n=1 Tax=Periweissella beninensis TaxID=504936 RepID=A0ABT0VK98_9LACO|nr:hypothetical protein [Periweissella beninensis]MBM7543761.1 Mg2+/citrate symporter [Periweissella beninensis]MCM2436855.1 hypothetical protein [Periweissella beninensis]MCT4396449.1 hypothetical protein [Periweissella beninensis]